MAADSDSVFLDAVERVLANEGGYTDDPADAGRETNFGISSAQYPELDLKNLTRDEAIEIYRRDYWVRYGYGRRLRASHAACVERRDGNPATAGVALRRTPEVFELDGTFQSSVPRLYVVGETSGTASIDLAMRSGRQVIRDASPTTGLARCYPSFGGWSIVYP